MDRRSVVLAALAASDGAEHTPVQVQKLFFLIDENIAAHLHGRKFNFTPYDYGPFDKAVYSELDALAQQGMVEIDGRADLRRRTYRLAPAGLQAGRQALQSLPPDVQDYIRKLSSWVRSQTFGQLVSAIYQAYPAMKVNSVFQH